MPEAKKPAADENGGKREYEPGRGGLFPNEYHKPGDRQPSMRGTVMGTDGHKYHAVAWTRFNSTTGAKYLSLTLQDYAEWEAERDAVKAKRAAAADVATVDSTDTDDMPF